MFLCAIIPTPYLLLKSFHKVSLYPIHTNTNRGVQTVEHINFTALAKFTIASKLGFGLECQLSAFQTELKRANHSNILKSVAH